MTRSLSTRVDVLRSGARLTSLQYSSAPSIIADAGGEIKTSLSVTCLDNPLIHWLTDRLRPVVIIDGTEYPLGLFVPSTFSRSRGEGGQTVQVEAYDLGYLLTQAKTETILHLAAGTGYITAIRSLLAAVGISACQIAPSAATLGTDREDWEVGTPYLTIVNQLLGEINYRDVWFDASGIAVLEPAADPSAAAIDHTYDATTASSVTHRDLSTTTDLFDVPNVFIVLCSNPDYDAPMCAVAENTAAQSQLSIASRGMRIPQVYQVDNIASPDELQAYADRLRDQSLLTTEETTIRTAIMPGHGIYDVVALRHPDASGIYLEVGWEISLAAGEYMTHRLRKVVHA